MSHISDQHQILGLSGISVLDQHCSTIKNSNKFATATGTTPVEKVMKSLITYKESMGEHIKANIVHQCMREAALNQRGILSKSTASKLKASLLTHELDKYMHLPSSSEHVQDQLILLGINDLPLSDLSPDEKLQVKCCIETMLRERIHAMILSYENLGGNVKEVLKSNECNMQNKTLECGDMRMVQWKNRIEELGVEYESALLKYTDLMDRWNKLKYEDMSQAYLEKSKHLLLQAQVAELQAKITKYSCIMKMFKETPTTIDAFKALNQMVEEKLKAIMNEISQKEESKRLYDSLKNTEYDKVLETYLELSRAIKKKKQIFNILK